jgi:hypothetical protein
MGGGMILIRLFSEQHPWLFVALLVSAILFLPSLIEQAIECAIEKLHEAWENVRLIFSMVPKDLQDWQPNYIPVKNIDKSYVQEFAIAAQSTPAPQREVEVRTSQRKQRKMKEAAT